MRCRTKNYTMRDLRARRGWTQEDVGRAVGVTKDYISQIERGRVPGMKTARELAALFGVSIDFLFFNPQERRYQRERQVADSQRVGQVARC